jgi:hypothetical protein
MGRAIDMENRQDELDRRLKLVEDALEELVQTRIHHVDLTEGITDIGNVKTEGIEVKPDEEFRAPVVVKKKRKAATTTT